MVSELHASLFSSLIARDIPDCEECRAEFCDAQHTLISSGHVVRHKDPPGRVVVWLGCPNRYRATWGGLAPADAMGWAHERGEHRAQLTAGGEELFREWWLLHDLPVKLVEHRNWQETKAKSGGGHG